MFKEWSENTFKQKIKGNVKVLFNNFYMNTTLKLWICWFSLHFISKGQWAIIPFILAKGKKQDFSELQKGVLGEIFSIFFTLTIIDYKIFGRKITLTLFFFVIALMNLMIVYFQSKIKF